jgi:hypothetical protein
VGVWGVIVSPGGEGGGGRGEVLMVWQQEATFCVWCSMIVIKNQLLVFISYKYDSLQ